MRAGDVRWSSIFDLWNTSLIEVDCASGDSAGSDLSSNGPREEAEDDILS